MASRSYKSLFSEGRQWIQDVGRGREPLIGMPLGRFTVLILEAVRLHYFAFGAGAALAGSAAVPSAAVGWRVVLAAFVAGGGWGVGQLINDLLDRDTDAINAPGRPLADGRLSAGPTLAVTLLSGLALIAALLALHPAAWLLAPAAVVLLVGYNKAKGVPLMGNLIHGGIAAVAGGLGVLGALPSSAGSLSAALEGLVGALPMLGLILAIDAWFILANYEKDGIGDRAAGYRTLPLLIGIRASALIRAVLVCVLAAGIFGGPIAPTLPGKVALSLAAVLGLLSVIPSLRSGTDEAALRGYRLAVPASFIAMLGLAAPLLGGVGLALVTIGSVALMEAMFLRNGNP
ncbi:UbiA family prenyltransferase [Hyalangium versicolor]|uniref:UbiA family prenyltransferase n=1 Tax=Hyalangium versicolor TaxID=2861190 RepID=UPI001CCA322A|nr:UbiA family prenyltransferase [Hyalangium versicolor]